MSSKWQRGNDQIICPWSSVAEAALPVPSYTWSPVAAATLPVPSYTHTCHFQEENKALKALLVSTGLEVALLGDLIVKLDLSSTGIHKLLWHCLL